MSSVFYNKMTATADALLTKFGTKVTFTRKGAGVYNPTTGTVEDTTETTFKGYGVFQQYKASQYDGSNILAGDLELMMQKMSKTPAVDDLVTAGGQTYTVVSMNLTAPAGTGIISQCQLRRGDRGNVR